MLCAATPLGHLLMKMSVKDEVIKQKNLFACFVCFVLFTRFLLEALKVDRAFMPVTVCLSMLP
jgi:hypothetical protein